VVHGPVREVVRGPSPLDWSTDRGSVFSGHPTRVKAIKLKALNLFISVFIHLNKQNAGVFD